MDQIARLRSLLGISEDRDTVDEIGERVIDRELRARDIAEVLPEAVLQAERQGRLTPSLEAPIEQTLRKSITRDPSGFADILYPVMGPAIRRSIADALRAALEGLNRAMEYGFSTRGLRWRLESWRTGVPFREIVLRHTMAYRVREAFLISKHSGLLMVRAGDPGSEALDRDAVAGMLTAIEDFVSDSTGGGDQGELSSAELGGHVLWVIPGSAARLALVVEGQPPRSIKTRIQETLEQIHAKFGPWMEAFDGNASADDELVEKVASCLQWESLDADQAVNKKKGRVSPAAIVLSLAALALLSWIVWLVVENRRQSARWAHLESLLAENPGLVYLNSSRTDDALQVSILADPAARVPEELALQAGFEPGQIQFSTHRFLSTEPKLVAARLRQALDPVPAGVSIVPGTAEVIVRGEAPAEWIGRLRQYRNFQSSSGQIRLGPLRESVDDMAVRIRAAISPPDRIEIKADAGAGVTVAGLADGRWRARAEAALSRDFPGVPVDWSGFVDARIELQAAADRLAGQVVYFEPGKAGIAEFNPEPIAGIVREVQALIPYCGCPVELAAVGCSDGSGSPVINESIRRKRAEWLRAQVFRESPGSVEVTLDTDCSSSGDTARKAYLRLTLGEP